ncbi:MAG: DUF3349 domain-containing protein [Gordonia sp. (in: high G+C Gram-positive bacteria)]
MSTSSKLGAVVAWLRKGYPQGIPQGDYVPLFALLRRQLGEDEVLEVAETLAASPVDPVTRIDAGVEISKVTDEVPLESDIVRVRENLEAWGWPFDDEPLGPVRNPGADQQARGDEE